MKIITATLVLAATILGGTLAHAGPDDAKWVAQCVMDNRNEGARIEVITQYCTCMNNKMDDNETRSITQWEKSNPTAMRACERESGWK